jgi:uncharacterized protein (DUF885 family)
VTTFIQVVVSHESDPATYHLTRVRTERSRGEQWPGETACGLIGELEMVCLPKEAEQRKGMQMCAECTG